MGIQKVGEIRVRQDTFRETINGRALNTLSAKKKKMLRILGENKLNDEVDIIFFLNDKK